MSFLSELCMHTALFIGFLTGFYYLYIVVIQTESLTNDLYHILRRRIVDKAVYSSPSQLATQLSQIDVAMENIKNSNINIRNNNEHITLIVTIVTSMVCPILVLLSIFIHWYNNESIMELIVSNLIVLFFIAASEFTIVGVFLYYFTQITDDFIQAIVPHENAGNSGGKKECDFVSQFLYTLFPASILNLFNINKTSSNSFS